MTGSMWTQIRKDITDAGIIVRPPPPDRVTEAELAVLPPAARAYMRFFGIDVGTRKHWSFRLRWTGRFRLGPDRPWLPIEALQYDLGQPITRVFRMRARMMHVLPVLARDTYFEGHGHMLAKLAGIITVADGRGKELDEGELVTWLDDVVLFAPSLLLGTNVRWSHVDAKTFEVAITDRGYTVSGRVVLDERSAPIDFETTDRYVSDPSDQSHRLVRAPWSTPVESWGWNGMQPLPFRARTTWHLDSGDFTYGEWDLDPASVMFDVFPGEHVPAA